MSRGVRALGSAATASAPPTSARPRSTPDLPRLDLAPPVYPFEFLQSKVRVPPLRPGTVSRAPLVNRLRATSSASVVTVVAPAGYGKTTLLAQWAERDPRQFAWVTVDDRDNDPVVLLRHIAAALERVEPVEPQVIDALRAPRRSVWTAALPRLAAELAARRPLVLVLDDFSLLHSDASLEAVAALCDDEGEGSMLVLASRVSPPLPLAPLRASGRLLELGVADVALSRREAHKLLKATGVPLGDARAAELVEQCEGWAAALYLAALSIRDGHDAGREARRFGGDHRYLADYFRSEYLSHLPPASLRFLRRTSILERMCGSLCDALLEGDGSARELERIERANLFLVPLDDRREWYRYHHLFRELLQRELVKDEPALVPALHGRAADWFQWNGDDESALEHAFAAGDIERAAALLAAIAFPVYYSGRVATLERWLARFEAPGLLGRHPAVALHGARIHALRGRPEQAERWLEAAERGTYAGPLPDGSASIMAWVGVVRAWLCQQGAERMLADATAALAELPEQSEWRPSALLAEGVALLLLGERERADGALASAARCAAARGSTATEIVAVGERALIAGRRGDHGAADELSRRAEQLLLSSGVEDAAARVVVGVTIARTMLRHGRWNEARTALTTAQGLLHFVTVATPWLAVQTRLELVRALVTLRDAETADELLDEADEILRRVPGLDTLAARAEQLRREVAFIPEHAAPNTSGLTPAELRLLPLLATHLSFAQIGEQLYVSRNTIKTQAMSVYRKLGVSSRNEAVNEAHRLGLGTGLGVLAGGDR